MLIRKTLFFIIMAFVIVPSVYSQVPDILWSQTFGGPDQDIAHSVQQTADGGYITTGFTKSFGAGDFDVYLIKADASGTEQWSKTFGGSDWDMGHSVQQTSDGGYIIAGETQSFGAGSNDVYLIKTDDIGNELWSQTYGDIYGDIGRSVQQTSDGGYIIAGRTFSYDLGLTDIYLIKTDASGTEQWSKIFGGSGFEFAWDVKQTSNGGYIIAAITKPDGPGYSDIYLIKTDASGTEEWSQTFGDIYYEIGYTVLQTSDGGYIIAGLKSDYYTGIFDAYLIKTDDSGTEQWSQTYGGSSWDGSYGVHQTNDGGYITVGYTRSFGPGDRDVYLIKTDASGTEQWSQTFGGSFDDECSTVQQTSDGGYIISGYTKSFGAGDTDVWLIKIDADPTSIDLENQIKIPKDFILKQNYPNPFNPSTTISFSLSESRFTILNVYDVLGNEVASLVDEELEAGSYSLQLDASSLPSGTYYYRISAGSFVATKKMILMK